MTGLRTGVSIGLVCMNEGLMHPRRSNEGYEVMGIALGARQRCISKGIVGYREPL